MIRTCRLLAVLVLLTLWAEPHGADEPALLAAGPMPAWSEATAAAIWVQTRQPCEAQIRFWPRDKPDSARLSKPVQTTREADLIAVFELRDLAFSARYDYELFLDGRLQRFQWPLSFSTQPHWRWRTDAPDFAFTLGSCLYVNEPDFDRPGQAYGGDFELLDALAAEPADFMLWLGDNVYLREPDWTTEQGMRRRYAHTRAFDKLQRVLATRHNYAVWDDHDYGPNDSDRSFRLKEQSLRVFKDYWPAQQYGTAATQGTFHRFEWADVEFFLLDDRYYRTPNPAPGELETFGAAQMQWLKDGLSRSLANFKVIVGGNQMLNPVVPYEGWAKCPQEREALLRYIVEAKINGVVFLSGDRHMSELIRVTPENGYPLYDFTCSPLSSGTRAPAATDPEFENPHRVPGTLVGGKRAYGRIAVSGKPDARTLTLSCHDKAGARLWQHSITRAELTLR